MRCLMRWLIPRDESMSTLCLFLGFFVTGVWSSSTSISSALRFPFAFCRGGRPLRTRLLEELVHADYLAVTCAMAVVADLPIVTAILLHVRLGAAAVALAAHDAVKLLAGTGGVHVHSIGVAGSGCEWGGVHGSRGSSGGGRERPSLLTGPLCTPLTDADVDVGGDSDELLERSDGACGVHQLVLDCVGEVLVESIPEVGT